MADDGTELQAEAEALRRRVAELEAERDRWQETERVDRRNIS